MLLNGGYTIQPIPAPSSTRAELSKRSRKGGSSKKETSITELQLGETSRRSPSCEQDPMIYNHISKATMTLKLSAVHGHYHSMP